MNLLNREWFLGLVQVPPTYFSQVISISSAQTGRRLKTLRLLETPTSIFITRNWIVRIGAAIINASGRSSSRPSVESRRRKKRFMEKLDWRTSSIRDERWAAFGLISAINDTRTECEIEKKKVSGVWKSVHFANWVIQQTIMSAEHNFPANMLCRLIPLLFHASIVERNYFECSK